MLATNKRSLVTVLVALAYLAALVMLIADEGANAQGNEISCPSGSGSNAAGTRCTDLITGLEVKPQGNEISCPSGSSSNAAGTRCTDLATGLEVEPISSTIVNPETSQTNPCPELYALATDGRCVPTPLPPVSANPSQTGFLQYQ